MITPFDKAIEAIGVAGYHNHRLEAHSDAVSDGILGDLQMICPPLRRDFESGLVKEWKNVSSPGDRLRKVDLFVGEASLGEPDPRQVRIAVENKSVITAHRNRTNRFDDLSKVLAAIHAARPEAILIATVLVGLCERVLNVPDHVRKIYRSRIGEFEQTVLPRLSTGDASLWSDFDWAISHNRQGDPQKTVDLMRTLPTRKPGHTHVKGYDYVLIVPMWLDNVNRPRLGRENPLGIDIDAEYQQMLEQICAAYTARWHM